MSIELSEAQRQALKSGEPVRIATAELAGEWVLLPAELFESMRKALEDDREQTVVRAFARRQSERLAFENPY